MYDESMIVKPVPKRIRENTRRNMDIYNMSLYDAFREAVRRYPNPSKELDKAWYYDDLREYIPDAYLPKYLDFDKYPMFCLNMWG